MIGSGRDGSEAVNVRLSSIVNRVDSAMSSLLTADVPTVVLDDLLESWAELIEVLAFGRHTELATCPRCGRSGPRAALALAADEHMVSCVARPG